MIKGGDVKKTPGCGTERGIQLDIPEISKYSLMEQGLMIQTKIFSHGGEGGYIIFDNLW